MKKATLLLVMVSLIFHCSTNSAKEGQYSTMHYYISSDSGNIPSKDMIYVKRSVYSKENDTAALKVFWRAVNNNPEPTAYGWENKFILQGENLFKPTKGLASDFVNTNDTSSVLTIEYNLPKSLLNKQLVWGLWLADEKKMAYRITLSPKEM